MKLKFMLISALMFIFISQIAASVTINGNLYDTSFENINNAILTINTTPAQKIIVHDSYSISVDPGTYLISVVQETDSQTLKAEEVVKIPQSSTGTFSLDIILFPDISEDISFIEEDPLDNELNLNESYTNFTYHPFSIVMIIIWIISIYFILKALGKQQKLQKEEDREMANAVKNEISELKKEIKENQKDHIVIR